MHQPFSISLYLWIHIYIYNFIYIIKYIYLVRSAFPKLWSKIGPWSYGK